MPLKEFLYNFWWFYLASIISTNVSFLFKILLWQYFKEFLYFFLCFSMQLDNNEWYARVGIFNCRTKYTSAIVRYCYNVNFFMNLFNKIKPELKLFLPFLIFCLSVTLLFLFIYILLVIFLYQKRFYCYIFDKEFFLFSRNISMNKLSLDFLIVSLPLPISRFSIITT